VGDVEGEQPQPDEDAERRAVGVMAHEEEDGQEQSERNGEDAED
jgi:hypothetical protein